MIFLIKLKPFLFSVGLLLEALGGAGIVYSFRVQKIISLETSLFHWEINTFIAGIIALLAGFFFHFIFFIIKNHAQKLEDDLFESKHSYSSRPVQKKRTLKSLPAQYTSAQNVNHWPSEKQPFPGNAQPQYDTQQQQRFQRTYQQAAQQTYSPQNQQLRSQTMSSSTTVKPAPAQQKGVYNAYYVPQQSSLAKEKDFDKLLDSENEFTANKKGLIIKVIFGGLLLVLIIFGIRAIISSLNTQENTANQITSTNTNGDTSNVEKSTAIAAPVSDKIVLTSEPSGATIVSAKSNRVIGTTPFTIKNPPADKTISLNIQKSGYEDSNITITYNGGVLNKHAVLTITGQ